MILVERIESTANPYIKELKKLKNKSDRYEKGLFLVEGENCVRELVDFKPELIECLLFTEKYEKEFKSFKSYLVSERIMESLCDTKTPQGIVALCRMEKKANIYQGICIYLDNVKDPGNVGTIIRTADAADIKTVILSKECADLYNSKTVRSTMGSMFHIDVFYEEEYLSKLYELKNEGYTVLTGSLQAEKSLYEYDFSRKTVICIGNEAHGISDDLYSIGTENIKIPMPGNAESLNAGVAGSIIIYEAVRQLNG